LKLLAAGLALLAPLAAHADVEPGGAPPKHSSVPVLVRALTGFALGSADPLAPDTALAGISADRLGSGSMLSSAPLAEVQLEFVDRHDTRWSYGISVGRREADVFFVHTPIGSLSSWSVLALGEFAPIQEGTHVVSPFLQLGLGMRTARFSPAGDVTEVGDEANATGFAWRAALGCDFFPVSWGALSVLAAYSPASYSLAGAGSVLTGAPDYTAQAGFQPLTLSLGVTVVIP
jgi:hypothetical protein